MNRLSTRFRLVLGLVSLTVTTLLLSELMGLFPNSRNLVLQGRAQLCESLAIYASSLASKGDLGTLKSSLRAIANRNDDIESIAIRRSSGTLLLDVGEHSERWKQSDSGLSNESQVLVPIASKDRLWGTVEVCFRPIRTEGWLGALSEPLPRFILFTSLIAGLLNYVFLRRILVQLNPSGAVPSRVRAALDTLTQGLVILDPEQRIVLANQAFCKTLGQDSDGLVGRELDQLDWRTKDGMPLQKSTATPWSETLQTEKIITGAVLELQVGKGDRRSFVVGSAPVLSETGECKGALVSLEDVTESETTKRQLRETMQQLNASSEAISRQNVELERLATTDPLTECLNRRSFMEQFDIAWKAAESNQTSLACVMVDIDHFKRVNDTRGHSAGDEVLKAVAAILRSAVRGGDRVCRFGGEEFCLLLPKTDVEQAIQVAERCRQEIAMTPIHDLSITASFGVSERSLEARQPSELLEHADQSLYFAKEHGRNRVVSWSTVAADRTAPLTEGQLSGLLEEFSESASLAAGH